MFRSNSLNGNCCTTSGNALTELLLKWKMKAGAPIFASLYQHEMLLTHFGCDALTLHSTSSFLIK